MDHALETPAEREATGKNRQGNVFLRSYVQSGEIILEVEDDGRGISAERVCEKAVSKGVITADQASRMTEKEKVLLIFQPGFSTKDQATDVSGRGVGMDVVRNNIENVGGTIDVETRVGQGSTFSAILPLAKALVSSSLTKALIVDLHGEQFAIPETAVSEIIRFDSRTNSKITRVDGQDVFQLRDKLIAVVNLEQALKLHGQESSKQSSADFQRSIASCLVVFQYRKHLFGAIVDNVVGIQEIIVRSTPKLLQNCAVYSGHTVLGTGRVSLILDINGLVQKLSLAFAETAAPNDASRGAELIGQAQQQSLKRTTQKMLVFSCADNEFFAIPLELVAIIERISPKDLRMVGQKEFCQLKQETISVMRLDSFLPIGKFNANRDDFCLVRAAAVSFPIGILTGPDVSVIDVDDTFETRMNDSKGILGTFLHQNRLVMLLDLYSAFEKHAPDKIRLAEIETKKARILVAEDSLFFRRLIEQYIRCEHWEVEIVNDGIEAWEKLQNEPGRYQLVISDINMPRMDGFELATRVREDRRFDSMPMVALTTLSDDHFRERGLKLGFDRYVVKIDKHQVRHTVAECLNIKRATTR
jgi:two-component system chemotaxis sensor kinase CheA